MPIPSGLSAQLGAKRETVYGTPVTVDHFFEFNSESLALDKNYITSQQLRAGRLYQSSSRRVATTRGVSGTIDMEVPTKGFGFWLDLFHDNVVTPSANGAAFNQLHNVGQNVSGKTATIQVGRPDSSGVVNPFTYPGAVVTGWSFSCDLNDWLKSQLTIDAQDELSGGSAPALAAASYPSNVGGFNFAQGAVRIGGTQVGVVKSANFSGGQSFKTDRYFFGTNGLKSRPLGNGYATGEGTLGLEFDGLTSYNYFKNGTLVQIVMEFIGNSISGANEVQTVTITGTPTGGTFTLAYWGQTTTAIAYNANAATVQAALEALPGIGVGNVAVTGGPGPGTPYVVTFQNALAGRDIAALTAVGSFTGGASPAVAVTTTTPGGPAERFQITMASVGFNGSTPNVDGPDVLDLSAPIIVLDDGTNSPFKFDLTSTDSSL
jgi:hypothetical protein